MSIDERRASGAAGQHIRPYFFLSYARTPKRDPADKENPDRWVQKLYKDLCNEILQMTDPHAFLAKSGWAPGVTL